MDPTAGTLTMETVTGAVTTDPMNFFDNGTTLMATNATITPFVTEAVTNSTLRVIPRLPTSNLPLIQQILTIVMIAIGMIGIGCTVNYKTFIEQLKKPRAYITGVLLQLLLVPLIAWALAKMFQMPETEALGVMIQGCSPGGTTSNLVVYWMDGIVDLSVVMTASSTLLALGTMPLWLFIFSKAENINEFTIPFEQIGISLACLVLPLALGIFLNWKFPNAVKVLSRIFIVVASLGIVVVLVVTSVLRRSVFRVSWQQVVVACIMPLLIFVIGYLATLFPFLRLNKRERRTVAVETSLQNAQIAGAVITLTFVHPLVQLRVILFPLLYYVFQVSYSALFIGALLLGKKMGWIKAEPDRFESSATDQQCKPQQLPGAGEENPTFVGDEEKAKENSV